LYVVFKNDSCQVYKKYLDGIYFFFSNDGAEFGGSLYQRINDDLEGGVNLAWTAGNSATRFGLAAKYTLDKDVYVNVSKMHST